MKFKDNLLTTESSSKTQSPTYYNKTINKILLKVNFKHLHTYYHLSTYLTGLLTSLDALCIALDATAAKKGFTENVVHV